MAEAVPKVGVVVVNWFGGERTLGCLESLRASTWPADRLVPCLVDNGSEPGFADDLRRRFPEVRYVDAGANLGFGGACNRGFDALRDCDHIALLNNDATPDPGWLEPLVAVLESDRRIGAAVPKVLLEERYVTIEIHSSASTGGDPRALGVQLCGVRVDGVDVTGGVELVSGFWGWERDEAMVGGPFAWTDGQGCARVPVATEAPVVEVRLGAGPFPKRATVRAAGTSVEVDAGAVPAWIELGALDPGVVLINSAGTVLLEDGALADRGFLQPDDGRFDEADEVFGWSGAAVLLARHYLDDVGGFDARYFLYYEDGDLSWRGRLRGWRYRYEPASVVRHEHSATTGARSPLTRQLAMRNRLVLLTKSAPGGLARRAVAAQAGDLLRAVRRDVLARLLRGRRPVSVHLSTQGRVLAGYARLLPATLAMRRRAGSRASRTEIVARWTVSDGVGAPLRVGGRGLV